MIWEVVSMEGAGGSLAWMVSRAAAACLFWRTSGLSRVKFFAIWKTWE